MSWWAVITAPFILLLFSVLEYINFRYHVTHDGYTAGFPNYYVNNLNFPAGIAALDILLCFWMFIPWRTQLPIIFNRKTRKVTSIIQGKWVSQQWDYLESYIKDITTFAAGGAPANEGVLTLAFPYTEFNSHRADGVLHIGITATTDHRLAVVNRGIYGAAQIWEFIRLYMREGASALPPSSSLAPYSISRASESVRLFNPLKVLKVQHPAWLLFAIPFFLFIALPVAPLLMLGDISYMWLDRILPRRKWPQKLIDACDGVWDGREG